MDYVQGVVYGGPKRWSKESIWNEIMGEIE